MSATDSDDFGRCKWCGNLTDSAGCLNITCAAQSARRDSQVSGIEETVAKLRLHLRDHADHEAIAVDGYTMEFVTLGDLRTL